MNLQDIKRVAEDAEEVQLPSCAEWQIFTNTFTPELCAALVDVAIEHEGGYVFGKTGTLRTLHALLQEGDK